MPLHNELKFEVKAGAPAEFVERLLAACAAASPAVGVAEVSLSTNFYSDSFSVGPQLEEPSKKVIERIRSDPFERVINFSANWRAAEGMSFSAAYMPALLAFEVSFRGQNAPQPKKEGVLRALRSNLEPQGSHADRFRALPDELAAFHRSQQEVFAQQQAELLKGHAALRDAILQAEARAQSRIAEVEAKYKTRGEELDKKHQDRSEELEQQRKAMEKAKQELDDRGRMHVRREHQKLLTGILAQGQVFSHSGATNRKRLIIHATCIGVMAVSAALYANGLGFIGDAAAQAASLGQDPERIAKLITGTVLFGSTLVFYLRWLNDWFRGHAQAEVAARALSEDFARASWLVELLFEWTKDNNEKAFPQDVLSSLSRGLFTVNREVAAHPDHPIAELISALPQLRKLSANKKNISLELQGTSDAKSGAQ